MTRETTGRRLPTRREFLTYGGAVASGGALAGCAGAATTASSDGDAGSSHSVSIEPMGSVSFDEVPETWVANNGSWADMGIALGLEPPKAVWLTDRYHTQYYDSIPGVSVDKSGMVALYQDGVSKERFYALGADVHVMDPNFLMNRFGGWDRSDVDEIERNVAPMFGNCIYAQHYPWHEDYRYYTLFEAFEKLAQVFQRTDRYEAFEGVHESFQTNLADAIPSESPEVAVLWGVGNQPESFYPYVIGGGTGFKHLRDLGVDDALATTDVKDFHGSRAEIDLETVLEVDPEVLLLRGYESMSTGEFQDTVVSFLDAHDTASQLTAVENGDVYRAGSLYQGPITNLVLTERTARHLYDFESDLFDRERVADIVTGSFDA
ncbi:iron complex transport system substrate-binding protein [Haloplanus vescus]|uniref:Iron complex transport system substrate-binding protein n=1 Tax=Haloplanus vescus TaxID=555874 RepID=A0A1H3VR55_9EURY|nr:ABC transporter substrate-binding protein [Haloplanus vescus]SDZ76598.1 iron complex transport system substrate-binding protein [Haloplanus vescus]